MDHNVIITRGIKDDEKAKIFAKIEPEDYFGKSCIFSVALQWTRATKGIRMATQTLRMVIKRHVDPAETL